MKDQEPHENTIKRQAEKIRSLGKSVDVPEISSLDELWRPPHVERWPTAEELRVAASTEEDIKVRLWRRRQRVPLAGPETLTRKIGPYSLKFNS